MSTPKLSVSGIAVRSGVSRNGITYVDEELKKFSETLAGRPILKDHDSRVDNTIGLITHSSSLANGREVAYSGWIKEDGTGVLERINDGRIKEVSIGAMCTLVKESEDSEEIIATNMTALELSLTPTPGVVGTSLIGQTVESVCESLKQGNKDVQPLVETFTITEQAEVPEAKKDREVCPDCDMAMADCKCDSEDSKESKSEVNNMEETKALQEQLNQKDAEARKLSEQIAAYQKADKERAVAEYKSIAQEAKVKEQDVSSMTVEMVRILSEQLRGIKVDQTKGHVATETQKSVQVTESYSYGNSGAIVMENGLFIERPTDGSKGIAMSCDPSKLNPTGARWRMFKHSSSA